MHRTIAVLLFTIMCCFAAANIASAKSNKPNVDLTYGYERRIPAAPSGDADISGHRKRRSKCRDEKAHMRLAV